jgi:putative hydrolase of the HAD superfamily
MTTRPIGRIPPGVRAIFFDAVGTVIHPEPSAGEAYAMIGSRFGSRLPVEEVLRRFSAAFKRQEAIDLARGHRTDEERERTRWQEIVAEVLDDVAERDKCFQSLYEHFAQPAAWRCDAQAARVIRELTAEGYRVGLATNFDHRLRAVVAGLPELSEVASLVISSEVGWKKPAAAFFSRLCQRENLSPPEVLLVGDDPENDLAGAQKAGLRALLLDTHGRAAVSAELRIRCLEELLDSSQALEDSATSR